MESPDISRVNLGSSYIFVPLEPLSLLSPHHCREGTWQPPLQGQVSLSAPPQSTPHPTPTISSEYSEAHSNLCYYSLVFLLIPETYFSPGGKVASHAEAGILNVLEGFGNNNENKQGMVYEAQGRSRRREPPVLRNLLFHNTLGWM